MFLISCRSAELYFRTTSKVTQQKPVPIQPVIFPPSALPSPMNSLQGYRITPTVNPMLVNFSRVTLHQTNSLTSELSYSEVEEHSQSPSSEEENSSKEHYESMIEQFKEFVAKQNLRLKYDAIKESLLASEEHLAAAQNKTLDEFIFQLKGLLQIDKIVVDADLNAILVTVKAYVDNYPDDLLQPLEQLTDQHLPAEIKKFAKDCKLEAQIQIQKNLIQQQEIIDTLAQFIL